MNAVEPTISEEMERHLSRAAREFPYPRTPDLAAVWRAGRREPVRLRPILGSAVLIFLVAAALFVSVPQVRAAVLEFLDIGAVRILLFPPEATPATAPRVDAEPVFDLAGATSLEDARTRFGAPIPLPSFPSDLGPPDHVYFQDIGGPAVVLLWQDPEQPGKVSLGLHVLGSGALIEKLGPVVVAEVSVHGQPALWTRGPYMVQTRAGHLDAARLVEGHVLIWAEGEVTYRLETDEPLETAIRIAESLR